MPKLPKTIYVKKEQDQNDKTESYLIADETMNSMEDGETVGIYELKDTRRMVVTKTLK